MATKKGSSKKKRASKKSSKTTEGIALPGGGAAAEPSAARLKAAQTKLNSDPRLRARFLKDPGGVLRSQGISLGADREKQLVKYLPRELVYIAHHWLILHGRYICTARNPKCEQCGLRPVCNFYIAIQKQKL